MGTLKKIGLMILILAAAFGAGRYSAPVKVEEIVKTETETKTITKIRWIKHPDGREESETVISDETNTTNESQRIIKNDKTQYKLSGLVGRNLNENKDVYGAMVEKRLFANSMVGVWGTTDKQIGVSLSVEF